uniref:SMB domain-containing protein n=1 Tax=Clastoptera arizonana TaxID=38151 RepID=A0A1B6DDL1_9HEMI
MSPKMKQLFPILLLILKCCTASFDLSDIPGDYCASRVKKCCPNRDDGCSVPLLGSLCYCDQFCDRKQNDDCCPDFLPVCRNISRPSPPPSPIKRCWYKGKYYDVGEIVSINCNDCKCLEMGPKMEIICEQDACIIDSELLQLVNRDRNQGWLAGNYSEFWGKKLERGLAQRLGTLHSRRKVLMMKPINSYTNPDKLPKSYDLRTELRGGITPPLDQGWCGSSWAMSTVGVVNDRLFVISSGEDSTKLSPQHLLSCNLKNQRGCSGGHLTRAWKFIQKFGLVPEECYPWLGGMLESCPISKNRNKDHVMARCVSGRPPMVLHRTGPAYRINTEGGIMKEIMTTGSVQATMKVYHDFFMYKRGIYKCSKISGTHRTNYHSVRIVGWGEERQQRRIVKYWIVANSWGQWWGENGYFRITRGVDECEIEKFVIGATVNPVSPDKNPFSMYIPKNNQISNQISQY